MTATRVRIATRTSPLAQRQAESVAERLEALHPGIETELVGIRSEGDRVLDRPLAAIGGKGLFVKALEDALLDDRADIAVHSMKDVPADTEAPAGLHLPVIVARESPYDAFLSQRYDDPRALPEGAVLGTSSPRRMSQLLHYLPGCAVRDLRGNVNTRLARLEAGDYDAIVLAVAGLERLGMGECITAPLDPALCLPAIGQGALGIECRAGDAAIEPLIAPLSDAATSDCVHAERAVSRALGGSCLSPIAAHGQIKGDGRLHLAARVGAPDGSRLVGGEIEGVRDDPEALGFELGRRLQADGADELLRMAVSA
ncbi:MAG: hydroxymethylbilane synthase [Halofilum sp. (in: g-proteobacteria)]